jgi:hypothetical protein
MNAEIKLRMVEAIMKKHDFINLISKDIERDMRKGVVPGKLFVPQVVNELADFLDSEGRDLFASEGALIRDDWSRFSVRDQD